MSNSWNDPLWRQFGATIDMFTQAISDCPDALWQASMWAEYSDRPDLCEFWYIAYHTLFWLDRYLSGSDEGFAPPAPFTLSEYDPEGVLPERVYAKAELQTYAAYCRHKCRHVIEQLTDSTAFAACTFPWGTVTFADLLLDNMRHVQEHGAQMRMFLGQQAGIEPGWKAQVSE